MESEVLSEALICDDLDTYVAKAIALAKEPALYASVRGTIESTRLSAPLFDTKSWTKRAEGLLLGALKQVHENKGGTKRVTPWKSPLRMNAY
eukprot:scaffold757_cov246-Pinguiococcus_pyrenoidosus.AAC.28